MDSAIKAILKNLQALKAEGEERVVVADETLAEFRKVLSASSVLTGSPFAQSEDSASQGEPRKELRREASVSYSSPKIEIASPRAKKHLDKAPIEFPSPPQLKIPHTGTKQERLSALQEMLSHDAVCAQNCRSGAQLVFGAGNPDSPVVFCGDLPGVDEESSGLPFVGAAGQLLDKIIAATGLSREGVYACDIMKWRPMGENGITSRAPTEAELAYCRAYFAGQIEIIQPKVIVALGLVAIQGILGADPSRKMSNIRGETFSFNGVPVIPTYSPSYVLRYGTTQSKRLIWEDFMRLMEHLKLPISDRQRAYFLPKV